MQPEITLAFNDGSGETVVVHSRRFSIGRSSDNDLAIDNSNLSRRHAVIESFDGQAQISDCGSQNGTEVNGRPVSAGVILRDGDLIRLGGVCELLVQFGSQAPPVYAPSTESSYVERANPPTRFDQPVQASAGPATRLSTPVIAAAGVVLIVIVAGLALLLTRPTKEPQRNRRSVENTDYSSSPTNAEEQSTPVASQENGSIAKDTPTPEGPVASNDVVEKAATQAMNRMSSDDKPYAFSEKALSDIRRKIADYRGNAALGSALSSLQRDSAAIAAQARQQGLEPGVLIYTALAQTDGGRSGDPSAVARSILPEMLGLRATFGTTDAESSLILIAAYRMGGGEKRSHPLLPALRRTAENPMTQRNVWYLHENGALKDEPYDFVVKALALATISQSPNQFGISAAPLSF